MRAREPDDVGTVVRDGVTLGYERYGDPAASDRPTILLLPTWTIIHARFWKLQVPYLARHFPVVVYDGPGNGASDRTTDPARYSGPAYAEDAAAVLDACGVRRAVAVGLSRGARLRGRTGGAATRTRRRARADRVVPPARPAATRAGRHHRALPRSGTEAPRRLGPLQPRLLARPLRRVHRMVLRAVLPRTALDQGARGRRHLGRRDRRRRPRRGGDAPAPSGGRSASCSPNSAARRSSSTATTTASCPTRSASRPPGSPTAGS